MRRVPCSLRLNGFWKASRSMATTPANKPLPLKGVRVLDMTRVLAGPYCTQILGDLGAEIIKIEHPIRGDDTRAWGPPFAPYTSDTPKSASRPHPGESAYYLSVNCNKKSLALSYSSPAGQSILHHLAKKCDILVENYLPKTLSKYSLSYEHLSTLNPSLIYTSITGYGQTGPYSDRAGYDVMVEAELGLMHITGPRDGPPVKVGVAVTDLTTGLYAANGILAALIQRSLTVNNADQNGSNNNTTAAKPSSSGTTDATTAAPWKGAGQHISISLADAQLATLTNIASSVLTSPPTTPSPGRWGTAHPSIVPYSAFPTLDKQSLLLGGGNDRLFTILCSEGILNQPSWPTDVRFSSNAARVANRDVLEPLIEGVTRRETLAVWLERLQGKGVPYAAVNDVRTALEEHPHTRAREMVKEVQHEGCGSVRVLDHPVVYSGMEGVGVRSAPPMLGEHTDEVLKGLLGLGSEELGRLREKGVIA